MEPEPTPPPGQRRATSTRQTLSEGRKSEQSEPFFICSLPEEVKTSTWLSELRKADIKVPAVYLLGSKIFQGSLITENMRARIRSFLMSQASKQWVMRETVALALTYIDLFFKHQGFCPIEEFQSLAISALILAMKIQEGKFPTVSFKVFPKEELLIWQRKLSKRLQYFLLPPTYVTIAEQLNIRWEDFTRGHPKYRTLLTETPSGPNLELRSLYEQLDCVFMVLKSLSWPLQTLVLNLFYLHVRAASVPCLLELNQLTKQEFIKIYYTRDPFQIFFQQFLETFLEQNNLKLDAELGGYLMLFLVLKPTSKEFLIKKSLDSLRIWDKLQTFPNECYALYKSIIEKLK